MAEGAHTQGCLKLNAKYERVWNGQQTRPSVLIKSKHIYMGNECAQMRTGLSGCGG